MKRHFELEENESPIGIAKAIIDFRIDAVGLSSGCDEEQLRAHMAYLKSIAEHILVYCNNDIFVHVGK